VNQLGLEFRIERHELSSRGLLGSRQPRFVERFQLGTVCQQGVVAAKQGQGRAAEQC
jgi:hypothetical protein